MSRYTGPRDATGEALARALEQLRPNTPAGHLGKLLVDLGRLQQRCGRPLREVLGEEMYAEASKAALDRVTQLLAEACDLIAPVVVRVEALERTPSQAWPFVLHESGGRPQEDE